MDDLERSLDYLLEEEGGWSNHPADRGGATMYGVIQATYNAYRKAKKLPTQSVRNITKAESKEIYYLNYWKAASCDRLPWPINYIVFDAAVNSGPSRAVKWLQAGLKLPADGKVGPRTIEAANRVMEEGDTQAVLNILDQRVQFLATLVKKNESQEAFLLGWWRRTMRVFGRAILSVEEEE